MRDTGALFGARSTFLIPTPEDRAGGTSAPVKRIHVTTGSSVRGEEEGGRKKEGGLWAVKWRLSEWEIQLQRLQPRFLAAEAPPTSGRGRPLQSSHPRPSAPPPLLPDSLAQPVRSPPLRPCARRCPRPPLSRGQPPSAPAQRATLRFPPSPPPSFSLPPFSLAPSPTAPSPNSPSPSLLVSEDPIVARPVSARNLREFVRATPRPCGPPRAAHACPPAPRSAGLSPRRGWLSEPPAPCPSLQPLLPLGAPVPPPGGGGLPPGGWRSWAAGAPGPAVPGSSG